jgi:hypothetical protein
MENEQLLAEVEDLIRNRPDGNLIHQPTDENTSWLGRVGAVLEAIDKIDAISVTSNIRNLHSVGGLLAEGSFPKILVALQKARYRLRIESGGLTAIAVEQGMVFEYFDEIRKIIETAAQDLLFVDPYLDADFVARYLGFVPQGVSIRLMVGDKKLATLIPSVDAFVQQNKTQIKVRSDPGFHDRYLFVDNCNCYQSGASFKDGGHNAPTTLTQISDAFAAMHSTYENIWNKAKVER